MKKSQNYNFDQIMGSNLSGNENDKKIHPRLKKTINSAKMGKGNIVSIKAIIDWLGTQNMRIQINLYTDCQIDFTLGYGGLVYGMNLTDKRWSVVN
jgi:hypothetical protein